MCGWVGEDCVECWYGMFPRYLMKYPMNLQDGLALEHASEEMKASEAIVTAAIQQNRLVDGHVLAYASEAMNRNEDIV